MTQFTQTPDLAWLYEPVAQVDTNARAAAEARQAQLTKPPGSLGRLEQLAVDFAGWQGRSVPAIDRIGLAVFAADHGVAAQGVSAFPQSVTAQMVANFAAGGAAVAVLARRAGANMTVVNLGTVSATAHVPGVVNHDLAPGTADFTEAPAMSQATLAKALAVGAHHVTPNLSLFVGGEMGIANTTSAAAVYAALAGREAATVVGRGTGVNDAGLAAKQTAVHRGLTQHAPAWAGQDQANATQTILRCLGGLEIAALTGAYIAAAQRSVPVVVDGFIASVAALAAARINPGVADWLVYGHRSAEAGHAQVLADLNAQPLLDLGMRLGEGSGAMMAVPVIQNALVLHAGMATFAEGGLA